MYTIVSLASIRLDLCCKTRAITVSFLRKFISRSVWIAKLCCQYLVCLKVLLTANITSRHSLVNVSLLLFASIRLGLLRLRRSSCFNTLSRDLFVTKTEGFVIRC